MNKDRFECPPVETYEIITMLDVFNCYIMVFITMK